VKTATEELTAFLNTARAGVKPDLYTFTLRSTNDGETLVPVEQTNGSGSYFIVDAGETLTDLGGLLFAMTVTVAKPLEFGIIAELAGWNDGDPRQMLTEDGDQIPDGTWSVGQTITFRWNPDLSNWTYVPPSAAPSVLRWTDADVPITLDAPIVEAPTTWFRGPKIGRSGISSKRGVEVSTLSVTFYPETTDLVGEVPLIPFIRSGGLDGAVLNLQRAFGFTHDDIVGTLVMFAGRVTNVTDISPTEVTIEVSSWLELLNVNMPRNLVQPPCLNTLYDAACGLTRSDWAVDGEVETGSTETVIQTDLSEATGMFDRGTIKFTSGANAGQIRTVRAQVGGDVTIVLPLPVAPAAGDTFTAYPGCDRTLATCTAKFDNRIHFRGQPFVPTPETAV